MPHFRVARFLIPPVLLALCSINAAADTLNYFSYVFFDSFDPGRQSNNTSLSHTTTENGATNTASSNLITGKLRVLNAGSDTSGFAFGEVLAQFGDTITATGPTGGLNLGVNFTENGTSSYTDSSGAYNFLWVFAYHPGTFDQTFYNTPSNILFAEGFLLGNGTDTNDANSLFAANNVPLISAFGDGLNSIPLSIPFSTLGSNFQLNAVLGTVVIDRNAGDIWSADFSHTVGLSLSAPAGVTLTSASGVLPGTSAAVPEPSSWLLAASCIAFCSTGMWRSKRRRRVRVEERV
jgi:hypothetical protein